MSTSNPSNVVRETGSVHTSRTLMVEDLTAVLAQAGQSVLVPEELRQAVVEGNLLGKRTERTRLRTWRYLNSAYQLTDPDLGATGFLRLWHEAPEAQGQLALLRAFAHDDLLKLSAVWLRSVPYGEKVGWPELAEFLKAAGVNYSEKTIRSAAQNLLSTWTQVGWLSGKTAKQRAAVTWHPAAITFLLFQEYRWGRRGLGLYESETAGALGLTPDQLDALASEAGRLGYLAYRRLDDVLEITFPRFAEGI